MSPEISVVYVKDNNCTGITKLPSTTTEHTVFKIAAADGEEMEITSAQSVSFMSCSWCTCVVQRWKLPTSTVFRAWYNPCSNCILELRSDSPHMISLSVRRSLWRHFEFGHTQFISFDSIYFIVQWLLEIRNKYLNIYVRCQYVGERVE